MKMWVFGEGSEGLERWVRDAVAADVATARDATDLERAPAGATWFCAPDAEPRLRAELEALGRAPASVIPVQSAHERLPWGQVAHEIRGPIGVVSGAIEELVDSEPLLRLAQRGVRQLTHLAACFDTMADTQPSSTQVSSLGAQLERARERFAELEPRRGGQVSVESGDVSYPIDAERFVLAVVRLLAHAVRATSESIRVSVAKANGGAELRLESTGTLDVPEGALVPNELWASSSRLAVAVALLEPHTNEWRVEQAGRVVRWLAVPASAGAKAPDPGRPADNHVS